MSIVRLQNYQNPYAAIVAAVEMANNGNVNIGVTDGTHSYTVKPGSGTDDSSIGKLLGEMFQAMIPGLTIPTGPRD